MAADLGQVGAAPRRDPDDADLGPDHEVLFPERTLTIGGEPVTVREYSFAEGLRIAASHRALLADLAGLFLPREGQAADVDLADLQAVLGARVEQVLDLIAMATGREVAWLAALSDSNGQDLLLTWWAVNLAFFTRRLAAAAVGRQVRATAVSADSSPSWSPGGTD